MMLDQMRIVMRTRFILPALALFALPALAQAPLNWEQVKARFESTNPNLQAGQLNIAESKTQEITAYLRPNPNLTASMDQFQWFSGDPYRPFGFLLPLVTVDYLHERRHKRELRLESAQKGTDIAESQQLDLERTMLFTLRSAFVQTLQAKQLLLQAQANLDYYNRELTIFRSRLQAGAIARVDLDRMLLQKAQYESDYQSALVNARTAKITLRLMLNDHTPVDQFDITGPFEFKEKVLPLQEFHTIAEAARPDLKAAIQAIDKAKTDYKLAVANGSTDPTFGVDFARNPPIPLYMGFSVNIPLRIFDRNQGEKARTQIDITHAERQREAASAQVFSDVDTAYFTLINAANLLRPYQGPDGYLEVASRVRDTMSFSYQRGQAALLDYLDAQRDYRATEVAYINQVAAYMTAASQLNLAVGREVIQ
jgi:cobalt-zinc-cadmium efflux system outer membrane protein